MCLSVIFTYRFPRCFYSYYYLLDSEDKTVKNKKNKTKQRTVTLGEMLVEVVLYAAVVWFVEGWVSWQI